MPPRKARSARNSVAALAVALVVAGSPAFAANSLDTVVLAYPETIQARAGNDLILRNGLRLDAGASDRAMPFDDVLTHASIRDMFLISYPAGAPLTAPAENFDPGRFRNKAFFDAMYGDCRKAKSRAISCPSSGCRNIGATKSRSRASTAWPIACGRFPTKSMRCRTPIRRAAWPTAGTYACRGVADANQPSMHAYGAAIDLNLAFSSYWLWDNAKSARTNVWRNRMPGADRRYFRAPRLHLGRPLVPLRHHAFRIPAGIAGVGPRPHSALEFANRYRTRRPCSSNSSTSFAPPACR